LSVPVWPLVLALDGCRRGIAWHTNDCPWELTIVSIDKSLKVRRGSLSNRNVLTRVERLTKLEEAERWKEGDPVLGMPKVRVQKLSLKKKKKTKKEEEGK
jgi:small basic protein (TIGR04137 family)